MSHQDHGRYLAEWADLIGASLPDSVGESEEAGADFHAERRPASGFGHEFGDRGGSGFETQADEGE